MAALFNPSKEAIPMGGKTLSRPSDPVHNMPIDMMYVYSSKASEFMLKQFVDCQQFTVNATKMGLNKWEKFSFWMYNNKLRSWSQRWFTHFLLLLLISLYLLAGAFIFMLVEGSGEQKVVEQAAMERKIAIRKVIEVVKQFGSLDDDDLMNRADQELLEFEKLVIEHFKRGFFYEDNEDHRIWNFWNSVFFCGSIFTTVGFGHPSPVTTTGRTLTVAYATIGIPIFLIFLTHYGRLFSRIAKCLWKYVRWVYYRGNQRPRRRTVLVQIRPEFKRTRGGKFDNTDPLTSTEKTSAEALEHLQMLYDNSAARTPVQLSPWMTAPQDVGTASGPRNTLLLDVPGLTTVTIEDDYISLPISVAIFILLFYFFCGAMVVCTWGNWGFFESFYFVFISMTTIGLGDFVPHDSLDLMATIIYLVFGLALGSMCVHVIMDELSYSFHQAVVKIGATIGLEVENEEEEDENRASKATNTPAMSSSGSEEKAVVKSTKVILPRVSEKR